jgi:hypothetical protein
MSGTREISVLAGEMNGRVWQPELGDALAAALEEQASVERYERRQWQVRRGRAETVDPPRPLEFDANGFPIAQRRSSFITRVARLRSPG